MAIGVIEQEQRMGNSFSAIQWLLELEQDPWSSTPLLLKRPDGNVLVRIFVYKQQLGTQLNINRKEIHCKAVGWLGSFRVAHFERLSKPVGSLGTWETSGTLGSRSISLLWHHRFLSNREGIQAQLPHLGTFPREREACGEPSSPPTPEVLEKKYTCYTTSCHNQLSFLIHWLTKHMQCLTPLHKLGNWWTEMLSDMANLVSGELQF